MCVCICVFVYIGSSADIFKEFIKPLNSLTPLLIFLNSWEHQARPWYIALRKSVWTSPDSAARKDKHPKTPELHLGGNRRDLIELGGGERSRRGNEPSDLHTESQNET